MSNDTALAVAPGMTVPAMQQEFAALHALKSALMRRGTDYGTIPGCGDKPTLFKPGAEKVLKRFMVHVTDLDVEDLSTDDCIRYRVRCTGTTPDGIVRGVGIGECSTDEDKYRWKKANKREYEDTQDTRRRVKHYANRSQEQVRTNPADLANTVLKMAKKRAMVDLALTATAASEFFTQDLESLDPEMQAAVAAERGAPSDPFAPPVAPIEVDCEVVDAPPSDEPKRISPKRQVWNCAKELGLDGNDVSATLEKLGIPNDSRTWKTNDVERICGDLRARVRPYEGSSPGVDPNYDEAKRLAKELNATSEEWGAACMEAFPEGVPMPMPPKGIDTIIAIVERMKGV